MSDTARYNKSINPVGGRRARSEASRLAARVAELEAEKAELTDALQCLYDEQQGPPLELPRHKASWQAAMDKASKLLEASND